jgi:hypothetical protein
MPKVFISYRYDDQQAKSTVDNWKNQGVGEDISFADLDETKFDTDFELKKGIREKIQKCQKLLVLVGNNTHNSKWVRYEIQQAQQSIPPKEIIWTQLPNTTGRQPEVLNSIPATKFSLNMIQDIIRKG